MPVSSNNDFPLRGEAGQRDWVNSTRYTGQRQFFLQRLQHMVSLRRAPELSLTPFQTQLLNHAIYSTYRDCVALDLTEEARAVLHGETGSEPASPSSTPA
jgi:hypothetical protein